MTLQDIPPWLRLALAIVPGSIFAALILAGVIPGMGWDRAVGFLITLAIFIAVVLIALFRLSRRRRGFIARHIDDIADISLDEHGYKKFSLAAGVPDPSGLLGTFALVPVREGLQLWRSPESGADLTLPRSVISDVELIGTTLHLTFAGREQFPVAVELVGRFGSRLGITAAGARSAYERIRGALDEPPVPRWISETL